jgi:hypothetical protein
VSPFSSRERWRRCLHLRRRRRLRPKRDPRPEVGDSAGRASGGRCGAGGFGGTPRRRDPWDPRGGADDGTDGAVRHDDTRDQVRHGAGGGLWRTLPCKPDGMMVAADFLKRGSRTSLWFSFFHPKFLWKPLILRKWKFCFIVCYITVYA